MINCITHEEEENIIDRDGEWDEEVGKRITPEGKIESPLCSDSSYISAWTCNGKYFFGEKGYYGWNACEVSKEFYEAFFNEFKEK